MSAAVSLLPLNDWPFQKLVLHLSLLFKLFHTYDIDKIIKNYMKETKKKKKRKLNKIGGWYLMTNICPILTYMNFLENYLIYFLLKCRSLYEEKTNLEILGCYCVE